MGSVRIDTRVVLLGPICLSPLANFSPPHPLALQHCLCPASSSERRVRLTEYSNAQDRCFIRVVNLVVSGFLVRDRDIVFEPVEKLTIDVRPGVVTHQVERALEHGSGMLSDGRLSNVSRIEENATLEN